MYIYTHTYSYLYVYICVIYIYICTNVYIHTPNTHAQTHIHSRTVFSTVSLRLVEQCLVRRRERARARASARGPRCKQ